MAAAGDRWLRCRRAHLGRGCDRALCAQWSRLPVVSGDGPGWDGRGLCLCIRVRDAVLLCIFLSEHAAAGHPVSARARFDTCHNRRADAGVRVAHDAVCAARLLIDESIELRFENLGQIGELREQKNAAEDANIAKSRVLAGASHDLRQPLHALGLFVQALQETPLATRERHVIGNIRRSVDAMEELFNALLDISRLDAGVVQPHITTIPVAAVFDRVRFEYGPIARQKRLSLKVMKTSLLVQSDPSLLARLIRNLLSNAVRYTDAGGVVLGCRLTGSEVRIEVWDTGKGIPPDRHAEGLSRVLSARQPGTRPSQRPWVSGSRSSSVSPSC